MALDYSFRIRFKRSPTATIQTEADELSLPPHDCKTTTTLRALRSEFKINDSDDLVVVGSGYSSAEAAGDAGREVRIALVIALARVRVGAEFGARSSKGVLTTAGLEWLRQISGERTLNDVHGLTVFQTFPKPRFASVDVRARRETSLAAFMSAYARVVAISPELTPREELSFNLFNASFFQPSADSRFLLLVMAVEALSEQMPRAEEVRAHVHLLMEQTKKSPLPTNEKQSILKSIDRLKHESIGQAARRIVANGSAFVPTTV